MLDMKEINALVEERNRKVQEARALNDANPVMSAEDEARYSEIMKEVRELKSRIDREMELRELQRENESKYNDASPEEQRQIDENAARTPEQREARAFQQYVRTGRRTAELRALQGAGSDSQGGYIMMPDMYVTELIKFVDDNTFMRRLARTPFTVSPGQGLAAGELVTDPDDIDWTTELSTGSEDSAMSFGGRRLEPTPFRKRIKVSNTLLAGSAISVERLVLERLGYKVAITEEKAFLTGTGANQPLGIFTAHKSGIPTSRDVSTDNTTTAITYDGLISAKYALKQQYRPNAQWIASRTFVEQAAKLTDNEGQYLWRAADAPTGVDTLLTMPVAESEFAPSTFTTGKYVAVLGDFRHYWIVDSTETGLQTLRELYAENNQTGYIISRATDGAPVLPEAFVRVQLA